MVSNLLLVGAGGALGSILRYLISRHANTAFPYGTLMVNLAGCFLIGLLWGLFTKHLDEAKRLFLVTGICGGFTTFSAFTYEGVVMMMQGRWFTFILYAVMSLALGLVATFAGFRITS